MMVTTVSESPLDPANSSDYSYIFWDDDDTSSGRLSATDVVGLTIYAVVFLLGVPGNVAVAWVTGAEARRRAVNAVWFLNLSVADLLCCLSLPLLATPLLRDGDWPLGDFACRVLPSLILLNMFASVLLLTAISADRCALALRPVWCQNHRTSRLAWAVCGASWALALLLTSPSFVYRTIHEEPFPPRTECVQDYGGDAQAEGAVAVTRFTTGFLVPLAVISGCHGALLARLRGGPMPRPLLLVVVVVAGFFLCWCPYHMVVLVAASAAPQSSLLHRALQAEPLVLGLALSQSCMNPILFLWAGRSRLRQSLGAALLRALGDEGSWGTAGVADSKTTGDRETTEELV
ncbi:C5a anaphylatoxin chemotactic receptor 2-like [Tachyglossus aculeatus]|uniref:C5a anaphylatoxin chemotactic receptor 2-like n=1 Tax=Tachyglossus aculeatus TaxID=9261 RepID=UPI0018F690CB|nr:C5a anaphylatoxin chemotactic receptor 2-like [Tachyglossus aculeatus]